MSHHYTMLPQTKESLSHILHHYELYKKDRRATQPMMVGISGCQGSGKTTLCDTLSHLLREAPYNLSVVNFSLDDFYLTHKDQQLLSQKYPNNPLYQQRGQAGSHDLELLQETFEQLLNNKEQVAIPVYDKSCFGGQGDRLPSKAWKHPFAPFDIILFEGWMLGFKPINTPMSNDVAIMNTLLQPYNDKIYPFLDIFIHLSPLDINQVYDWRLQQEHDMMSSRGVQGLSDIQVKQFVETYMPAYQLYIPRLVSIGFFGFSSSSDRMKYEGLKRLDGGYSQPNRHLKIVLDGDRKVVESRTLCEQDNIQVTIDSIKTPTWLKNTLIVRCVVIGVLGIIGYKRKSIITMLLNLFNKTLK